MKTFIALPVATVLLVVGWSAAIVGAGLASVAWFSLASMAALSDWAQS